MKNNKGITLIALVVTIIVLLILAGISIAMLTGQNGILGRASESSVKNAIGAAKDEISLAVNDYQADYYEKYYVDNDTTAQTQTLDEYVKGKLSDAYGTAKAVGNTGCEAVYSDGTVTITYAGSTVKAEGTVADGAINKWEWK